MASSTLDEAKLPGGYLVTPRVPQGLAAAVEGLTREVIRNSPEDIYVFAAHHFEKLLQLREECGMAGEGGGKSTSMEGRTNNTLMEMSRALRMREIDREHARTTRNGIDQVGWSLNQTAKVLKRHRSIFGEEGRRITTDEVFLMANQKENDSQSAKSSNKKEAAKKCSEREKSGRNDLWKASSSRTEQSRSNEDSTENLVRPGPKIITQMSNLSSGNIMLAKDIKTELRKNRISSRERRNLRGRHEEKKGQEKSDDKLLKHSGRSSSKKLSEKQKRLDAESEEKRSRKSNESTRSFKDRHNEKSRGPDSSRKTEEKSTKRTPSMDRVRESVVDRFATTRSLEELQSVNYVEKVQEIIDETGPIIKEKIEQLKSGVIGRSERSSWFANARGNRVRESNDESTSDKSRLKEDSAEISASDNSTSDALRDRLTETKNLMENVSSSFVRPLRRSRSARSFRRSIKSSELSADHSNSRDSLTDTADNQDNILERRLSKTRDLMEGISASLSKPMRRSSSAKSLRKCQESVEDVGGNRDALRMRLDETRNLLRGISSSFGKSIDRSRNKTIIDPQDSTFSEDQITSKSSLPAVRSISMRNSSGTVSRSDSDNLVLPAISPEAPKSAKIKEDLILPVLSPPGTASTNEDSSKIIDTNDDVPLEDFGILEIPVDDYVTELPAETLSRDSLNATPNFDSIPQRPDSLEPANDLEATNEQRENAITSDELPNEVSLVCELETPSDITGDIEAKHLEEEDVEKEIKSSDDAGNEAPKAEDVEPASDITVVLEAKNLNDNELEIETETSEVLENKASGVEDPETELSEVVEPSTAASDVLKLEENKVTSADLKSRLQEIERVQKGIEEALDTKTTANLEKIEGFDMVEKLRELEEAEKRIDKIFDLENRAASEDAQNSDKTPVEIVGESGEKVIERINTEIIKSTPEESEEKEPKFEVDGSDNLSDKLENISPEPLNYTYVLTEGSPYEIPDTVTTVIIPERLVESPLLDKILVEIENDSEVKLSLIPGEESRAAPIEEIAENNEANSILIPVKPEVEENTKEDEKSSEEDLERNAKTGEETGEKKALEVVDGAEASPKSLSDPFGELVRPETLPETSSDIEFIREIEDLQIPHQDLGPINEEVSEELDDLTEKQEAMETLRNIEKLEIDKEEILEVEEIEKPEEKEGKKDSDESKVVESDLSPEGTRPTIDSESSNEVKESSAIDEPLESAKRDNSIDDEVSSATRTPESSNEIKETTLTDALSLSLDPTRPFVPELNLDSLQDITVSSFKMTEDDYEAQERGDHENTNSITDTLTSDENNRNNGELVEEPVLEYLPASSSRSKSDGTATREREEVVEETIVKSQLEIEEDICEKTHAYVTGPSETEDDALTNEKVFLEMEKETDKEAAQAEKSEGKTSPDAVLVKTEEENISKQTEEEIITAESSNEKMEEIVELQKEDQSEEMLKNLSETAEDRKIVEIERINENPEISNEQESENGQTSKMEKEEKSLSSEETTGSKKLIENVEAAEQLQEEMESKKSNETMQAVDSQEDVDIETVDSGKVDIKVESQAYIEEEPDSSFNTENFESEVGKVDESVDRSNEKEVDIKSETIDTKTDENIDALEEKQIDGPKIEEIDTEEIGDIDMLNKEEIDTRKTEEINTEETVDISGSRKEEIDAENIEDTNGEKTKEICTPKMEETDTEEKEAIDVPGKEEMGSGNIEEIASEKSEGIDTQNLNESDKKDEIDTKKEEETSTPKMEEIDSSNNEEIDAEKKEEIDLDKKEKIDVEKKEEIDVEKKEEIDIEEKEEIDVETKEEIDVEKKGEIDIETKEELDIEEKEEIDVEKKEEIDIETKEEIDVEKKEEMSTPKEEEIGTEKEVRTIDAPENSESSKEEISKHSKEEKAESSKKIESSENIKVETGVEEVEDVLEESYAEEETPLAVSRSASQCTTRRVSSGNLARLREDPTLSWTEEIEREDEKSDNDPSWSKVTFSGINDETTNVKAVKENDQSVVSPNDVDDGIAEAQTTKDNKEYHIYVPEVDASEDYSTTESSTFDTAVTKIQAGVRGFLTRRRLLRGQQNRSSTLSGIPSIQDSIAIEPDDRILEASEGTITRPEETSISSSGALNDDFVDAATRIQSNYRGYKARKRLRREDAVQRTTFSLEKSFAESGLQHTGEFHDCIPLPIHDIRIERKASNSSKNSIDTRKPDDSAGGGSGKINTEESSSSPASIPEGIPTESSSAPLDTTKMFFGGTAIAPLIQFNMRPNVSQLVDLVVLAKEDSALQTGYLNFITSVEDAEAIIGPEEVNLASNNLGVEQSNSNESLKEPLALSDPPIGLIIEEIVENPEKADEENDRTVTSTISSSMAPEMLEESLNSSTPSHPAAKIVSGSMDGHRTDGNTSNRSEVEDQESGDYVATNSEHLTESEKKIKMEKSIEHEDGSSIMNFPISMGQSSTKEKEFLGPESSVDSIECPDVQARKDIASESSEPMIGGSASTIRETKGLEVTSPARDSSDRFETSEKIEKEESMDSNIDDSLPSKFSLSINVEDLLDLGSEDSIDLQGKKPFLEVTSKPTDLRKSMGLSQDSQLAGERIESPITMIQIAPGSSESLKQDEISDNPEDEDKTNEKKVSTPNSAKSDKTEG